MADDEQNENVIRENQGEELAQRHDVRKLILGIQRHPFTILFGILLWVGLSSLAAWHYLTNYKAEAVVLFQDDLPKTLPGGTVLNTFSLATALDLITLPIHFQAIKAILGLDIPAKQLEKMIEVPIPRNNSHLVRIICKGDNANLVVDIVNTLARISVKNSQEFYQNQLKEELENYKHQLEDGNYRLNQEMKDIEEFKQTHHYFEMTADYNTVLSEVKNVQAKLQNATMRYNSLTVEYEHLKKEYELLPDKLEGHRFASEAHLDPTHSRLLMLENQLAEAKSEYAPENPKIKILEEERHTLLEQIQTQIGSEKNESGTLPFYERNPGKDQLRIELARMQGKVQSALKAKEDLAVLADKYEKELSNLPSEQRAFSKLLQQKQIAEEQVLFLTKAVESIQLMMRTPKGGLEIYQLAEKAKPLKDSWWVYFLPLVGLGAGLFFGTLLAMAFEMLDPKISTLKQVEMAYTSPPLLLIPDLAPLTAKNSENKLLFFIRQLAEKLELISVQSACPIITFVSSIHNEGKSTLAFELARYFEQLNEKVVLLELDIRPHLFLSDSNTIYLEDYLRNSGSLDELVSKEKPPRIKIGSRNIYMKELLKSSRAKELLEALKSQNDFIIIDAPGVIEEDYAVNLAALADDCLFVINSKMTKKAYVDESLRALSDIAVIPTGIILNKVDPIFIEDTRIKMEARRTRSPIWQRMQAFFRKLIGKNP